MASAEHQKLLNALAVAMEKDGIKITHLDIDGKPEYFEEKYRKLPTPPKIDEHVPDLQGVKNDIINLGDAKTDINGDENIDSQFPVFASRVMKGTETPVPFHIIVPKKLVDDLKQKISDLKLNDRLKSGQILIWS